MDKSQICMLRFDIYICFFDENVSRVFVVGSIFLWTCKTDTVIIYPVSKIFEMIFFRMFRTDEYQYPDN